MTKKYRIPYVKNIIMIASGKGGVGKSTFTVGLAVAASMNNMKVGIIDVDINGPSIAHILGSTQKPEIKDKKIIPIEKFGIKFLSMGNLIDQAIATIWRSSMYVKILDQVIAKTEWDQLDIIFIDVPPGTGDIHLNLAEKYQIDSVVLISTPQELALLDVRKAINMYKKLDLPILGIVENKLFGNKQENQISKIIQFSKEQNIEFMGDIPFKLEILNLGDSGISINDFESLYFTYNNIFQKLLKK